MSWPAIAWECIRPYGRYLYYALFPDRRPAYFHAPWTFPPASPDDSAALAIFLPMTDWHARIQRSAQLARAIAEAGRQALYVNPHLGLEYVRPYLFDAQPRATALAPRVFELHIHLPCEHELHRRALTGAESCRIARAVGDAAAKAPGAALIVSSPGWLDAALELRRRYGFPIVYDCHDWLPGFGRTAGALLDAEAMLLEAADGVVFSSQFLQDRVLAEHNLRAAPVIIRNAAEPLEPAGAATAGAPPVIGYVGAIDHWLDIEAVAAVAASRAECRVELAGRVEDPRALQLSRYPNVRFLGEVPRRDLAALLQRWDVAMIPFLVNDLTRAANPIKLYEYFAAGLPVVSAPLPEVELYRPLVYTAGTPASFAEMVTAALEEEDVFLRPARIAVAARETWTARGDQLLAYLDALGGSARTS